MFQIDYKNLLIKNKIPKKRKKITTLNITGDWAPIHEDIANTMTKTNKKYYGNLSEYFKRGDLNITNLETVIDSKFRNLKKNALRFINKPKVLKSLKSININLACLANNHIMDNGMDGLSNTLKYLKKYKIDHVGAGRSINKIYEPFLFKKNNQKIAVINTSEGEEANEKYNNNVGASDIESFRVIDQIRDYKSKGYLIILIAHAGVEYIPTPPPYIKNIFKNFVDKGADLVVGHHPHVSQGFEIYKNVPIFYSLGNFTMWRKNLRKKCYYSFFLNIRIQNNRVLDINLVPFQIKKTGLDLTPKIIFKKKIIELNSFLKKSNEIWYQYLNRKKTVGSYFSENLSFFYNFNEHKNMQINKYTNLSRKYSDLEYLKNRFKENSSYNLILDRWEINHNRNFFSIFKNILNPIYKILLLFRRYLRILKLSFF